MIKIVTEETSNGSYIIKIYRNYSLIRTINKNPDSNLPILSKAEAEHLKERYLQEYSENETLYIDSIDLISETIRNYIYEFYPPEKQTSDLSDWTIWIPYMKANGYTNIEELLTFYTFDIVRNKTTIDVILSQYNKDLKVDIDTVENRTITDITSPIQLKPNIIEGSVNIQVFFKDNSTETLIDNSLGSIIRIGTDSMIGTVDYTLGSLTLHTYTNNEIIKCEISYSTWLILNESYIWNQLLKISLRNYLVQRGKKLYYKLITQPEKYSDKELIRKELDKEFNNFKHLIELF